MTINSEKPVPQDESEQVSCSPTNSEQEKRDYSSYIDTMAERSYGKFTNFLALGLFD